MIKDNKGLSAVVITVIMIALVLVAVAIVWVVYRNVIEKQVENIGIESKCIDVDIRPTKAACASGVCNTTVTRSAGGEDIAGIKLIFEESTGESNYVETVTGNIASLETKTISGIDTGLTSPNKVEVVAYFEDGSGNEQICSATNPLTF